MHSTNSTPLAVEEAQPLLQTLFASEPVVFTVTVGDNLAIAELMGTNTPDFASGWWSVETPHWHIHAPLAAIRQVEFVREPSNYPPGQESLSVRLLGPEGEVLLQCYFLGLYNDQNQLVAERFAEWESLREHYGSPAVEAP